MSVNASVRDILKGDVRFIDDFSEVGMLYGVTVRSTVARGRILEIRLPELPEQVVALRASDIPGANRLSVFRMHMPVLAEDEVNYIGEPILLLAGPDERILEQLRSSVVIEYEELPSRFSFVDHDSSQIGVQRQLRRGDPETALKEAYQVVEGEYQTGAQEHFYSDPQGAMVKEQDGLFVVYSSTQWLYHVHRSVCEVLAVPKTSVVVRIPQTGNYLDGKLWFPSLVAAHAALLCRMTGKPVKFVYDREEDFLYSPKRAPTHITHRTGLDREGNPLAMHVRIHIDSGAYSLLSPELLDRICIATTGAYSCENILIEGEAIRTNKPPLGAFSGLGIAHSLFAIELQSSRIAEIAQMDPGAWKTGNLLQKGDLTSSGVYRREGTGGLPSIEQVVGRSDFSRKYAAYELLKKRRKSLRDFNSPLRGIGLSVCYQGSGFLGRGEEREASSVTVRLEKDGKLVIMTSAVPSNNETAQIWKQRARKILGIGIDDIRIEEPDTALVPNSGPSTLSRNITIIRSLIEKGCQSIQKKRFRSPLPIEVKRTFHVPRFFTWDAETLTGDAYALLSWASTVVEVEIDPVSLDVKIRGIWTCVDGGTILNPDHARISIENGIFQSLGWVHDEFLRFRKGRIPDEYYTSYRIPGMETLCPITIDFVQHTRKMPVKGIGELPQNGLPAAYVAAVSQATGHYFDRIPLSPEMIFSYTEAT